MAGSCLVASFHARTNARTGPSSILRLMTCSSPPPFRCGPPSPFLSPFHSIHWIADGPLTPWSSTTSSTKASTYSPPRHFFPSIYIVLMGSQDAPRHYKGPLLKRLSVSGQSAASHRFLRAPPRHQGIHFLVLDGSGTSYHLTQVSLTSCPPPSDLATSVGLTPHPCPRQRYSSRSTSCIEKRAAHP